MGNKLNAYTYVADDMIEIFDSFQVFVRNPGMEEIELIPWKVHVDMHDIREAGTVSFDFEGTVEVRIICQEVINEAVLRPLSRAIPITVEDREIRFQLQEPGNFSLEINGDRFHNLHIFANPMETDIPNKSDSNVVYVTPGTHVPADLYVPLCQPGKDTLYFAPGLHQIVSKTLNIPSGKRVYLEGGAAVCARLVLHRAENVKIFGRGNLYSYHEPWKTHLHGMDLFLCKDILIEGIVFLNPSGHSISVGESEHVTIDSIKSFSCHGWTDGINFYSSEHCQVRNVFMRNSDDCITVYGSRFESRGGCKDILVEDSCLWADVAHPILIGTHGAYDADGDILEELVFRNLDILEHHEPQDNYLGCMAVNVGDGNTARNILFENVRVEDYERGRLIDVRVFHNEKYNPLPGRMIENVVFHNISYNGSCPIPSQIIGFDANRMVKNILFDHLIINGKHVLSAEDANMVIGDHVEKIEFT